MPDEAQHPATLPSVESMIAGTVALMTLWADPCPHCTLDVGTQRCLLAQKVVSNLSILSNHAGLGEGLRQVMGKAHQRWMGLADPVAAAECVATHGSPPATALH